MKISARALNRATLGRQHLLNRVTLSVPDAVRSVVALQAQHAPSPYLALWNRIADFDPAELDTAFTTGAVVKATLMRITLHAVAAADYRPFRAAVHPTLYGSGLGSRFSDTGLTPADARELAAELLVFTKEPRSSADVQEWLAERVGAERKDGAWRGVLVYAPLHHVPTGGPWSYGARPSFVTAGAEAVPDGREVNVPALRQLVLRCLEGFGPASVADVAQFSLVGRTPIREVLRGLDGEVEELQGPDGTPLFDLPGALRPDADAVAPVRLMAMWDSTLLAYADRSRMIPPEYRKVVIRTNGDVLPTLLVDGYVAGVWRLVEGGVEVTAFRDLASGQWEEVAAEAGALGSLLAERDPRTYSRYHHWWAKLPAGDVRLFPTGCS
ncbi:winged helix DNA-binding domain-containing protein [Streptomyces sp. NBC_00237]|uniref:winged helix DNA-binding domain-containing protein n=1 Tax=Streptomyces sp. NBC_00237 TaxID=2975687 RepID=UPI0022540F5E|nr:winged helix DNA-binding domain-containing protein [Streptomyces sp. NBC_00237]MCX5205206.1 winged helix DNA-binding domain-containing protein [Streptomyces sp. NBC_00237]